MIANMLLLKSPIISRLYHSPKHICNIPRNRSNCDPQIPSQCSMSASPVSNEAIESPQRPKHVVLIVDGHRRWARERGMSLQYGYHVGFMVNLRQVILSCLRPGMRVLTVYVFSCNNWTRSKEEVEGLMGIFEDLIRYHIGDLIKGHNLRFSVIGDKSKLPKSLQNAISSAEASSKANNGMHFVMALSYSGRYKITEAVKKISHKIENGTLRAKDIDDSVFEQHLDMSEVTETPSPNLLNRTGGESRLSNFMLWQMPYTELYFCDKSFPEFEESDIIEALCFYTKRERRFGK